MLKKSFEFVLFIFCVVVFTAFVVSAECAHNFKAAEYNSNLIYNDDFSHSYYCINGCGNYGTEKDGINGKESCSFSLVSETKATCVSEGKKIYVCTICYRNKEKITETVEHSYKIIRRLPTCTESGYDLYSCTCCGINYKDNLIQPIEHLSDGGIIEAMPTYDKQGIIKTSCRVCGCLIDRKTVDKLVKADENINTVEKVSGFKVKSYGTACVKLVWDKAEGAISYKIFYSTDKKKWKTVSAQKTYITVKNLKSARKYYFKISAVGEDSQSDASKIITACTKPEKAVLLKLKSNKKSAITLEWKKLNGVSGYEISYTADSFKKKKTVKVINATKGSKKTLKKLKSGKKYYFKVRAYKNFGSKKIFGAYSKVKSLRIK